MHLAERLRRQNLEQVLIGVSVFGFTVNFSRKTPIIRGHMGLGLSVGTSLED